MHLNQFLNLMGPGRDNSQSRRIMLVNRASHPYSTPHGKKTNFRVQFNDQHTVVSAVSQ